MPAVPELHLRQIARYCQQRVPEHACDQVQVSHRLRGRSVTIVERRPPWRADFGPEWSSRPVAQLRWTPSPHAGEEGSWRLYWADRNSRWHLVPDVAPAWAPGPLLDFIDRHPAAFGVDDPDAARVVLIAELDQVRRLGLMPGGLVCGADRSRRGHTSAA